MQNALNIELNLVRSLYIHSENSRSPWLYSFATREALTEFGSGGMRHGGEETASVCRPLLGLRQSTWWRPVGSHTEHSRVNYKLFFYRKYTSHQIWSWKANIKGDTRVNGFPLLKNNFHFLNKIKSSDLYYYKN